MGSADAHIQKWFGKFLYQSFIIRNNSYEILVESNVWLLIDNDDLRFVVFSQYLFHGYVRYAFLLRGPYLKQLYYVMKPIVNLTCVIIVLLLTGF